MGNQKQFGITHGKQIDATAIRAKKIEYPTKHYILLENEKVTLDKLSNRLLVNPARYLTELEERISSMQSYAKTRNLQELMITITSAGQKKKPTDEDIRQSLTELNKTFKQIRQLKAWTTIQADLRLFVKVVEPHKSGNPHFHILLWIPKDTIESFVAALFKKFKKPQINIISEYIPLSCQSNKLIQKSDKSMISYIVKNISSIVENLKSNNNELSDLTAWYILYPRKIFSFSQTLAPSSVYSKVKNLFSLLDFTAMLKHGVVQLWYDKNKSNLVLITQGEAILWESQTYKIYDLNIDNFQPYIKDLPTNIDPENLFSNTLHFGKIEKKLNKNGAITLKITSGQKESLIDEDTLLQEKPTSLFTENMAHFQDTLDEVLKYAQATDNKTNKILDLFKNTGPRNIQPEFLSTKEMAQAIGKSCYFLNKNKGVRFFEDEHYFTKGTKHGIFWDTKAIYSTIRKTKTMEGPDENRQIIDKMFK